MCGIAGFLGDTPSPETTLDKMTDALRHRGPDGEGHWLSADGNVALGFRRLAILDLSPTGNQPMESACGRYVLIFNGEIYNYSELKTRIQHAEQFRYSYRGTSDTEVLLSAFTAWGIEATLSELNGMFAIAVWDREEETLTLARDRAGEKPLYYGWFGGTLLFGSELKAFFVHPKFKKEIDPEALSHYLRLNYVPAPHCIFKGVAKLPAGHFLRLKSREPSGTPEPYWKVLERMAWASQNPLTLSTAEIQEELLLRLKEAVRMRMVSDVPLGAFLSGGVDSSAIVSLMQASSSRAVKTFTIGFADKEYDESPFANEVAQLLHTDHTCVVLEPNALLEVVPKMAEIYDEPFADSSQIPTYLVSQVAKRQVTVSLSGDGGDELFGGYPRFQLSQRIGQTFFNVPKAFRKVLLPLVDLSGIEKLKTRLRSETFGDFYLKMHSQWEDPNRVLLAKTDPRAGDLSTLLEKLPGERIEKMMYFDYLVYLADDILTKVDRASMAASLESRAPFLDHTLTEFCWRIPPAQKFRQGEGKWILKQVLKKYLPGAILKRPKRGFSVPIASWMRGPLKPWAEALLSESTTAKYGLLDPKKVAHEWKRFISGETPNVYPIWNLLMLQAWCERHA